MALVVYKLPLFVNSYEVIQPSLYTGDGTTDTFELENGMTSVQVGDTVQVDLEYFARYLNGFSFPDTTHITISEAPPLNSQVIVPGNSYLEFSCFDQASVDGVTGSANVVDVPFWVAEDGTGLTTTVYDSMPGTPGVGILFTNVVSAAGAQIAWMQLACADASGNALTYQATGTTLYTGKYAGFTQLASACAPLATTLLTVSGSATLFVPGDYIRLNPGGVNSEDVQITSKAGNTLTITGTNFAHSNGENVFMVGRKFWARLTLPIGILNGAPATYYNLPVTVQAELESRL
jgi:hypothetical protein